MLRIIIILFSLITMSLQAFALSGEQNHQDSTSTLTLPPLDSLFKWAEANSPLIREQMALIEKTTEDTKRIKKIWLDAVKLSASVQNGNFGDPTVNKLALGYSSGIAVSFSLYQFLGMGNLVKVYKAEGKVAISKKEQSEYDTRKMVIILYNNIMAQRNVLKIRSEASLAAYTHMKMAEKEFKEGSVAVGELSRVMEIYTKAQVDYELGFNDLKTYYMELELMIGRPLQS